MKNITIPAILFLLISGCTGQGKDEQPASAPEISQPPSSSSLPAPAPAVPPSSPQILKGVSLSPKSFGASDFTDFLSKSAEAGSVVSWAGDWNELGSDNGAPKVVAELSKTYGYEPLVEPQFFTQSSGKLLRPLDAATKEAYKKSIAAFAGKHRLKYIGMGIEVNVLYEKSPADFEEFAAFYPEVYDAIKKASPSTKVFTIFQLERMKGRHGGLFGGENDAAKAQWQLLDRFSKSDMVAFTTYPSLIYKSPLEIPQDYYSEIFQHTSKPIAFTEIGWHSAASPAGWESSEEEQVEFVDVFFNRSKSLEPELAIWSFLYDQDTVEPFDSMGLVSRDGKEKSAWEKWKEAG